MIRRWAPLMMAAMMVLAACQGTGVGETTTTESTMGPTTTTTVPAPSTLRVGVVGAASDLNWWAVWGSPGSDLDRARRWSVSEWMTTVESVRASTISSK